jgi:hypothetical protein
VLASEPLPCPSARPIDRSRDTDRRRLSARVDADLRAITEDTRAALGRDLVGLLLVGGYARGEGGAVEGPRGLAPYNDYDLVAVVGCPPDAARERLARVEARWTEATSVHVDIWPAAPSLVARPPHTLFWLDVGLGGVRVLAGEPRLVAAARRLRPRDVPLSEAARLLANRAVGLALSNLKAGGATSVDDDATRHVHKAVIAVGDAILLDADRYRGTVRERLEELLRMRAAPGVGEELCAMYAAAAAFRERPDRARIPAGEDPARWYARAVDRIGRWHLAFEARRAGTPLDPAGYALFDGRIFAELPDVGRLRALGSTLRAASRLGLPFFPWVGHPRERVARVAAALAYGHDDQACRTSAATLLGLNRATPPRDEELRAALLRLIPLGG